MKEKPLELSTPNLVGYTSTLRQDLGMLWRWGQEVKGQGHAFTKSAAVVRGYDALHVDTTASMIYLQWTWMVCVCCSVVLSAAWHAFRCHPGLVSPCQLVLRWLQCRTLVRQVRTTQPFSRRSFTPCYPAPYGRHRAVPCGCRQRSFFFRAFETFIGRTARTPCVDADGVWKKPRISQSHLTLTEFIISPHAGAC